MFVDSLELLEHLEFLEHSTLFVFEHLEFVRYLVQLRIISFCEATLVLL